MGRRRFNKFSCKHVNHEQQQNVELEVKDQCSKAKKSFEAILWLQIYIKKQPSSDKVLKTKALTIIIHIVNHESSIINKKLIIRTGK